MRLLPRVLAGSTVGLAVLLSGAVPAHAEEPFAPRELLTDSADVLSGSEESEVTDALESLQADGVTLRVVFVDSFDEATANTWAEESFELRGMGGNDILYAVAVEDRNTSTFPGPSTEISATDFNRIISNDVEPRLTAGDWSGAAITLAEELESLGGGTGSGSGGASTGSGGGGAALAVLLGIAVVGGGGYLLVRNRSRKKDAEASEAAAAERAEAEAAARDPHHGTSTEQLTFRASEELLALDEAVTTSELDLAYARAQYGEEPVAGFGEALATSKAELSRAFTLRQELDDDIPEDEPTQRAMLTELLTLTSAAGNRLAEQAEAYAELRKLAESAPQSLDALTPLAAGLRERLPAAQATLADLQQRYAATAWDAVADNVGEADARIDRVEQLVVAGRAEIDAGNPNGAVPAIRAGEDSLAEAHRLLDAVERTARELRQAPGRFEEVQAETERDIAEARALLARGVDTPGLRDQLARAEAALAGAADALRPSDGALPDPVTATRRLDEADMALEAALEPARDLRQQQQRAAAHLPQAIRAADASVGAAGDFVSTRRGAVGSQARTRLAEAERFLDAASRTGSGDPVAALRAAQRADALAQQAMQAAQADVQRYHDDDGYGPGYGRGGYGGGYRGGYGRPRVSGGGFAGGLLGGLLLGGLGGGHGGGFGGGGSFGGGGAFGGGGSFGGGGGGFGGGSSF